MALSPEIEFEDIEDDSEVIETSQTYKIDFENGSITNEIITGSPKRLSSLYICLSILSDMHILFTVMTLEMSFKKCWQITKQQTHIRKWRSRG